MTQEEVIERLEEAEELVNKASSILLEAAVGVGYLDSPIEEIKEAIIYSANHDFDWDINNAEMDITYIDEPEKREIFFGGRKQGYLSALFWLSDFFGDEMVNFFENKIGWDFENLEREKA